jgi:hypothetical protein
MGHLHLVNSDLMIKPIQNSPLLANGPPLTFPDIKDKTKRHIAVNFMVLVFLFGMFYFFYELAKEKQQERMYEFMNSRYNRPITSSDFIRPYNYNFFSL